jgi:hypothetical protein
MGESLFDSLLGIKTDPTQYVACFFVESKDKAHGDVKGFHSETDALEWLFQECVKTGGDGLIDVSIQYPGNCSWFHAARSVTGNWFCFDCWQRSEPGWQKPEV